MNLDRPDRPFQFDDDFEEVVELDDGTAVLLRLIGPEDREKLERGFEELSWESRYSRFLGPKSSLSEREIEYLVNVDQWNHIALGAMLAEGEREGKGIGIARSIRLHDEPRVAEAAVTIVDEFQHQGLGRMMLVRLVGAARERGIEKFRATLFAQNRAMKQLLEELGEAEVIERDGPVVTLDIRLGAHDETLPTPTPPIATPDKPDEPEPPGPLRRVLSLAGRGTVSLVDKFRPHLDPDYEEDEEA